MTEKYILGITLLIMACVFGVGVIYSAGKLLMSIRDYLNEMSDPQ